MMCSGLVAGECTSRSRKRQTAFVFQRPRLNNSELAIASTENASVIAQNTPAGPIRARVLRNHARGISKSQNTNRFKYVGVHVSPAPLNDWFTTMPYA